MLVWTEGVLALKRAGLVSTFQTVYSARLQENGVRAEFIVRNVETKPGLFRATTALKEILLMVVPACLLFIFIFIVSLILVFSFCWVSITILVMNRTLIKPVHKDFRPTVFKNARFDLFCQFDLNIWLEHIQKMKSFQINGNRAGPWHYKPHVYLPMYTWTVYCR